MSFDKASLRDILYRDRPELYFVNHYSNDLCVCTENGKSRDKIIKDIKKKIKRKDYDIFMKMVIQSIDIVVVRNDEIKNINKNITNRVVE